VNPADSYPRDLIGYAGQPPDPRWPGNSRIAVSVVLNYEEGGEYNILHGDAHSEFVLTDVGGEALQNARNLNVESNFEYGSRVGFWEIMRTLRRRRVAATVYAIGMALERNPPAAA
jgi:peptidoglycan/xylan/chitin deacetylase (PgdA/CDA1 family)